MECQCLTKQQYLGEEEVASAGTRSVGAHNDENLNTETMMALVRMGQRLT